MPRPNVKRQYKRLFDVMSFDVNRRLTELIKDRVLNNNHTVHGK